MGNYIFFDECYLFGKFGVFDERRREKTLNVLYFSMSEYTLKEKEKTSYGIKMYISICYC